MKLEEAIQQQKFRNQREKLIVNLLYTASWIKTESGKVLKQHGLSIPLFNVLRILKGQNSSPVYWRSNSVCWISSPMLQGW
jgi:hypothetical protein